MGRICVHLSTYNDEKYIHEAVESVFKEALDDFEILLINDGSTDGTARILQSLVKAHSRIRLFNVEENIGQAAALRRLVEVGCSKYFVVVDADDIFIPGWMSKTADFLDKHPEFAGSYGKILLVNEFGESLKRVMGQPFSRFNLPYENPICHPGMMMRRSALLKAGNYQETGQGKNSVAIDRSLWYRVALNDSLHFDNTFRFFYRQHSLQRTQAKKDMYKHAEIFIKEQVINSNRNLYTRLINRRYETLTPSEIPAAVLILGILSQYADIKSLEYKEILDVVGVLAPNDYGLWVRKYSYNLANNKTDEALASLEEMIKRFPSEVFIQMTALRFKAELLERIGNDTEAKSCRELLPPLEKSYFLGEKNL